MKFVLFFDDNEVNLKELQRKAPNAFFFPVVREMFVPKEGKPVYLSKSDVKALEDAAAKRAFEHVKCLHENSVYGILNNKIDSVYYDTDSIKDISKASKKEE